MTHKRSDYRREESDAMHAGPPLDLSFKNASAIDGIWVIYVMFVCVCTYVNR